MPIVNIYLQSSERKTELATLTPELKNFVSEQLTCSDIKLKPDEISVRLIESRGDGMIAEIEIEIFAHSFKERVERQDEICLKIRDYLKDKAQTVKDVRVWLALSELGHSWK
jgi:hypothetical protein